MKTTDFNAAAAELADVSASEWTLSIKKQSGRWGVEIVAINFRGYEVAEIGVKERPAAWVLAQCARVIKLCTAYELAMRLDVGARSIELAGDARRLRAMTASRVH